jgi:hypothetical protein
MTLVYGWAPSLVRDESTLCCIASRFTETAIGDFLFPKFNYSAIRQLQPTKSYSDTSNAQVLSNDFSLENQFATAAVV